MTCAAFSDYLERALLFGYSGWAYLSVVCTQNASLRPKAWCIWSSWFQRIHLFGCSSPTLIVLLSTIFWWMTRSLLNLQVTGGPSATSLFRFSRHFFLLFVFRSHFSRSPYTHRHGLFSVRLDVPGIDADDSEAFSLRCLKRFPTTTLILDQ